MPGCEREGAARWLFQAGHKGGGWKRTCGPYRYVTIPKARCVSACAGAAADAAVSRAWLSWYLLSARAWAATARKVKGLGDRAAARAEAWAEAWAGAGAGAAVCLNAD